MQTEEISQLIKNLLEKLLMPAEAIEVTEEGTLPDGRQGKKHFRIRARDSHLLIGTRGAHLFALNHLVKKMVAQKERPTSPAGRETDFLIDVNDYQKEALTHLKTTATIMGERARSFKTSIELEPMSAYERMTIHSFFEGATDLMTESVGIGDHRRVVIKYKGE